MTTTFKDLIELIRAAGIKDDTTVRDLTFHNINEAPAERFLVIHWPPDANRMNLPVTIDIRQKRRSTDA